MIGRTSDPGCSGWCTTADDLGVSEYGDMIAYARSDCPAHGYDEDIQCSEVAGMEYGQELRCTKLDHHSGECAP